jgi:hypothetical protein
MVIPLFEKVIEEDKLYNIKIFWPSEIILVLIL